MPYNNQAMSIIRKRWFPPVCAFILLLAAYCAWHFDRYRKIPIEHAINPVWWYRHIEGTDLYDPSIAMLYHGNPKYHEVALTIDDGPNRIYGPQILSVLEQYHVPATFFVVGVRVKDSPDLIRRMVADGDEVANHTYDHQRLNRLKPHQIANELRDDDVNIFNAAGVHTTVMRPPGEDFNNTVLHVNKALGYVTVYWTDAAKDYLNQSPNWIADRIMDRVENGSIILLHQDTPDTAQALPSIITKLKAQGYQFVTINTMLAHLGVQPYASQPQLPTPTHLTKQ